MPYNIRYHQDGDNVQIKDIKEVTSILGNWEKNDKKVDYDRRVEGFAYDKSSEFLRLSVSVRNVPGTVAPADAQGDIGSIVSDINSKIGSNLPAVNDVSLEQESAPTDEQLADQAGL